MVARPCSRHQKRIDALLSQASNMYEGPSLTVWLIQRAHSAAVTYAMRSVLLDPCMDAAQHSVTIETLRNSADLCSTTTTNLAPRLSREQISMNIVRIAGG